MAKEESKPYPEDIKTITIDNYKNYTLEEILSMISDNFKQVENDFKATHKDITVSITTDYSNCYYEGEYPDVVLEFHGIKHVGGKKRN